MNFEQIIGLEVHCELKTNSKMFSASPVTFGKEPNTMINEIDMAMPGETLDITIELIQPIKITEEEPFIIRNDECTVGLGRISTIIE